MENAPKSSEFCDVLADARRHKLKGYWSGSAYRSHPCGVYRKGIIFTNNWSTFDYCSAEVVLDPTSPMAPQSHNPSGSGDPFLRPERGGTLRIYSDGQWQNEDGPWRKIVLDVIAELKLEIAEAEAKIVAEKEIQKEKARVAHAEIIRKAHAALESNR